VLLALVFSFVFFRFLFSFICLSFLVVSHFSSFFFSHVLEERRDALLTATNQQLLPDLLELIEFNKEEDHRVLQQHLIWALINLTRNRDDLKEQFGRLSM
jgi:hypothetical protein